MSGESVLKIYEEICQNKICSTFLQLHSEYKSTYRWHEFTPKSSSSDIVKKQPKIGTLKERPNFPTNLAHFAFLLVLVDDFLSFSRKKKHPDLAYKSHELFDVSLAPPFPTRVSQAHLARTKALEFAQTKDLFI